jgi:hypothetical protein
MTALQIAYTANLAIHLPVAMPTLLHSYRSDQGWFPESRGWRVLVGSLWTAIMTLSAMGLRDPLRFSPVLLLQLTYKSLWLLFYVLPSARKGDWRAIPAGITTSFTAIVFVWPWLIPWSYLCR